MSLDLSAPLLPSVAPLSSPDFITTHSRKPLINGTPSQKSRDNEQGAARSNGSKFECPNGPCGSENCNSATCRTRFAPGVTHVGNTPHNASTTPAPTPAPVDRRVAREPSKGFERRQFGSSHANLTPAAAELAVAIDQYKLEHHRRYITCEEMLMVITKLGYKR